MRFEVSHPFDASPDDVARAMLEPAFQDEITDIGHLHDREVLALEDLAGGGYKRSVRCVLALEVSGIARSMLGDSDPAWVQEENWNEELTHCEWTIHPEVAADLLSASGTIDIEGSDGKATRTVTGEVKVRVPLYGGKVEGWIVNGVSEAYDEEAQRLTAWLEREK
jgi:hypothetical protein